MSSELEKRARDEAESRYMRPRRMHVGTVSEREAVAFRDGVAWRDELLNDHLHEYWETASIEEVRRAFAFQGAMTRALLEEQEKWVKTQKVVGPGGWFLFGTHVDFDGPLEFSAEVDDGGMPLWERHVPTPGLADVDDRIAKTKEIVGPDPRLADPYALGMLDGLVIARAALVGGAK